MAFEDAQSGTQWRRVVVEKTWRRHLGFPKAFSVWVGFGSSGRSWLVEVSLASCSALNNRRVFSSTVASVTPTARLFVE